MDNFISGGLEMNNKSRFLVAGVLAVLCAAVTANAYVFDNFESAPSGWTGDSRVVISNGAPQPRGASSFYIPTLATITNTVGPISDRKVWTDFFTVPRQFVSESSSAPTVDTNATAQFFVNSNGMWVTISGDGAGGTVTNVSSAALLSGTTYPTVTQYSAFYHVSVLHDYASSNWSLFVDNVPLATNLHFIASGVSTHAWFQVQNLGGNVSNVCWLDDFLITNKMATSGSGNTITNVVPGTTIPVADALAGFGAVTDPRPTNKTVGVIANGVNFSFGRMVTNDQRTFVMVGTGNYDLSGLSPKGALDANGSFTDTGSFVAGTKQYYKLVTTSADGSVVVTNNETYAAYRQSRALNRIYYVGAPVDPRDGDRTVGGTLGNQLASGLATGDMMYIYTNGASQPLEYRLNVALGGWLGVSGESTGISIPVGQGVTIRRVSGLGASSTNTFLAGTVPSNAPPVVIYPGYNIVSWPYASPGTLAGKFTDLTPATTVIKDYIYLQNGGSDIKFGHLSASSAWMSGYDLNGGTLVNDTLQPGAAIVIRHIGPGNGTWTPSP